MQWPRGDEYLGAVQNPDTSFYDPELKTCNIETMMHGLPKPYAGNFTTTYHLYNHSNHWAVRCFTRDIPDLQKRYEEIGRFLQMRNTDFFVDATCIPYGILIDGQWYPVIKMQWVEGEILNQYINQNISNQAIIESLSSTFQSIIAAMDPMDLAHGDLQHGNIMVKNGRLYLIDYDGMYLPALSYLKSNELGHPNYQHPMRSDYHYDANMDHFSSIVIWIGLKSLSVDSQLWDKYNNHENILFTRKDFFDPDNSQLLSELATYPQLFDLVDRFKGVCFMEIDQIPTLDQFISGNFSYSKVRSYNPNFAGIQCEAEEVVNQQTADVFASLYQDQLATPDPLIAVVSYPSTASADIFNTLYSDQEATPSSPSSADDYSSTPQPIDVNGTVLVEPEKSALAKTGSALLCGFVCGVILGLISGVFGFIIGFLLGAYIGSRVFSKFKIQ